ncbi:MAG: xanthine dehydrogenase family protein subunit M [Pseudomonadota bacterium]|nr:xanthine dehydrogenase family protein subunit M [Chloroflexota bacterium]MDP9413910.1 xanthine dehydrogenase family protein subunit M [Pseudomonadota bacterium]
MRQFDYHSPNTIDEVITLLEQDGDGATRPLAGGTDLLTLMKGNIASPTRLLDIKRLGDLPRGIEETQKGLSLGALTTLTEIEAHPLVQQQYPALAEAAALAATPQLRNMATLGGNLLQRPRCWYFRDEQFHCWLKGGDECQARDGMNQQHALLDLSPCVAVHPSDLASALVALDAQLRVRGPNGERVLPLQDFFAVPEPQRRTENVLGGDELVLSVHLSPLFDGTRSTYLKAMDRKVWAFALVGVAARIRINSEGRIEDARIVLSGVAPVPWRVETAEQALIGMEVSETLFDRVADTALADAQPLDHNGYKVPLAKSLIRRALATMTADQLAGGS